MATTWAKLVVLQLSKQELIFGPAQIAARINQDQTISKDLTLWNQQGSHVLRAQTLVLPVDNTFLYVDPIYIQSSVSEHAAVEEDRAGGGKSADLHRYLRAGHRAAFRRARRQLIRQARSAASGERRRARSRKAAAPATADQRLERVRAHLRRYRELAAQGKWAEAGKELEAIEAEGQVARELVAAERLERSTYGL